MTTLTFHLGRALGRALVGGRRDRRHRARPPRQLDTWRQLAKERGLTVKAVPFRLETGQLDMDALGARHRAADPARGDRRRVERPRHDQRRPARRRAGARRQGALVFVDAVHYAPHALVDVAALGSDFLACSAYKFYGPHVGVLWGRQSLLDELDLPRLEPAPASAPENLETGTQNHEGIVGAAAAVEFLASLAEGPDAPRAARGARSRRSTPAASSSSSGSGRACGRSRA